MVRFFNFYYFLYIFLAAGLFTALFFALRKAGPKAVYWTVFGLLAFNLCLHFSKLAFLPYRRELPTSIRKITFENICAVSTLVFPFFYISKNKYLRDYMFYLGTASGIIACFIPTEALGKAPFIFDTVRFYICHIILWIAPLLMVIFGEHKLNYHRILCVPTIFLCVEALILVNEVVLTSLGLVEKDIDHLLSSSYRNSSFIFGIPPDFEVVSWILLIFVPKFMRSNPLTGEPMLWPLVWLIIPVYIYLTLISFLFSLFWEHKHVKEDFFLIKEKFKRRVAK